MILWCLERNPAARPTAKEILTSGLLPRKVELEQSYLDEVLQALSDPKSEQSYRLILSKLFERPNPKVMPELFNFFSYFLSIYLIPSTCVSMSLLHMIQIWQLRQTIATTLHLTCSLKASQLSRGHIGVLIGKLMPVAHNLSYSTLTTYLCVMPLSVNVTSSPMSAISTAAASTAIRRARNITNLSGGGKEGEGEAHFTNTSLPYATTITIHYFVLRSTSWCAAASQYFASNARRLVQLS